MKLADSLNAATQAENIKKLNAGLEAVDAKTLPDTSTATTGQILKLTGENKTPSWADEYRYTPPAYSATETATGRKWIDGKDIYFIGFSGTTSETTGNEVLKTIGTNLNIIDMNFVYVDKNFSSIGLQRVGKDLFYQGNTGAVTYSKATSVSLLETAYICTVFYTKPDPVPETREDDTHEEPEVKETKITRKKTTK